MLVTPLSASMRFTEAAELFLGSRATLNAHGRVQYIAPRTHRDMAVYLKTLGKFFGQLRLDEIHGGHLANYQLARANGDGFTRKLGTRELQTFAGAAKINDETDMLKRVMTAAAAWKPELEALYVRLQVPDTEVPKALSPAEQEHFLMTAAASSRWHLVWWYSLVALHTTFSSDEMRTIRQGDINLTQKILGVNPRYGKNRYRRRQVPLYDGSCLWGLERLVDRSINLVGQGPERYLFPRRLVRNMYDGNSPMSETGLRKSFEEVRVAAGVPWFCINGWRHTAITRMAESGVSIAIIMKRAGHTTMKMSAHYTHISEQAERDAMAQMDRRKPVVSIDGRQPFRRSVSGY